LFIDTIGFVVGLDPALIKAFELNLMDMNEADLLLFMIGVDDEPEYLFHKLKFGLHLLRDIGVENNRILIVLNKLDLFDGESPEKVLSTLRPLLEQYEWTSISAKNRKGVDDLLSKVLLKLKALPTKNEKIANVNKPTDKRSPIPLTLKPASPDSSASQPIGNIAAQGSLSSHDSLGPRSDEEEGDFDKPPLS
jgi:50S ribosomal subunit-associated GTPase HflX